MASKQTQEDWIKTALRLPRDLHKQVHDAAAAEDRTFNSQLVTFVREGVSSRAQPAAQPQGATA